jgi:hypothetical protein
MSFDLVDVQSRTLTDMKTMKLLSVAAALAILPAAHAQKGTLPFPVPPPTNRSSPPPLYIADPPPPPLSEFEKQSKPAQPAPPYVYGQKPAEGRQPLVTAEQARTIITRFKAAYPKLGSPRLLIYVNRESADTQAQAGMKPSHRAEPIPADKQTARDVEQLFGRPFRAGGAVLADQAAAAQLMADKPLDDFIGTTDTPQARKNREALGRLADAVVEILVSSKTVAVPAASGAQTVSVPDIQATVIGLKDARILGQSSSADLTSRIPASSLAQYDVRELSEATALALMDDMTPAQ